MNKGYKFKLKIIKQSQIKLLKDLMFSANQAYNIIHSIKSNEYAFNKNRKLNNLPPEYIKDSQIDQQVTQILQSRGLFFKNNIIQQERIKYNLDTQKIIKKYGNGFDSGKRKYKSYRHNDFQSFKVTSSSFSIKETNNKKIKILRMFKNDFKIIWSRDLPSKPKTLTISFDGLNFYVSFVCKIDIKEITHKGSNKIGLDMNNQSIDLGNKKIYESIKINKIKNDKLKSKLKKLERQQSKRIDKSKKNKVKLGNNFYKTAKKVKTINKKITNQRNYRIHQMTNDIIQFIQFNKLNHVIVEDLNVKQMTKKTTKDNYNKFLGKQKTKSMKKNILDISYSRFLEVLEYKCEQFGIMYSKVNPKNTSKQCSQCNNLKTNLELKDRIYKCDNCGLEIKRDYNACLNIMNRVETTH